MVFSFHTYRVPVEAEIDAYYASFDPCTRQVRGEIYSRLYGV